MLMLVSGLLAYMSGGCQLSDLGSAVSTALVTVARLGAVTLLKSTAACWKSAAYSTAMNNYNKTTNDNNKINALANHDPPKFLKSGPDPTRGWTLPVSNSGQGLRWQGQ